MGRYKIFKLKELSNTITKGTTAKQFADSGINFIKIESIMSRKSLSSKKSYISKIEHENYLKRSILQQNDILFSIAGALGIVHIVQDKELPANTNQALSIIRLSNKNDTEYVAWFLETNKIKKIISELKSIGAQPNLSLEQVGNFNITYYEDKKSRDFLVRLMNSIEDRIETQNKIIEDLKLLMKRSIDSLLRSKLQAKNIELRQLLTERKDKNKYALSVFSVAVEEGVVNQEEHLGRSFAAKDTSNYNIVKYGDVVYTKSPTGLFPYGIVKQSFNKEDVAVSPLYGIYEPKTMAVGNYLHYYFLNPINTNNYLHPLVNKGAKNTMNITNQRFLDGKIAFPESYIESLVGFLSSIKTKFDFNVKLLEKYQLQKKYLLDNLFI
ncbi:MAG: hypothetical protein E7175_00550 [Erysipelotrichaceae bacterium]|nr:hypothetical protein [Erysipelotrichaceae bacterium]